MNASLPIGTTQNVVAKPLTGGNAALLIFNPQPGVFMDVASTPSPVLNTAADLALSQASNVGGFTNGQPRTFDLTVNNQGPDAQIATQLRATALPFKDPVVTPSQGTCTLGSLTSAGRLFTCNLGTLANNALATVKVTVTRVADDFATANDLTVQFFAQDPAGFFPLHPNDQDGTNNSLQQTLIFNR